MGCYIQLLEQCKDGWRIRFGGPSDEFWFLLGNFKTEQKRSYHALCYYDQSFFQGKGGWFCHEHVLVKYAAKFDNYDFMRAKAEKVYEASGKAEEDRREREAEEKARQERRERWEEAQKRTREREQSWNREWEQAKQPARPPSTSLTLTEAKSVLGLSPVAQLTEKEVKTAYRLKARETHPDAGGSHQAFVKVNLAYQLVMFNVSGVKV